MHKTQTNPHPAVEIEALDRSRRQMLASVVAASILWFLPQILQDFGAGSISQRLNNILILAGLAGAAAWMICMWRFHRFRQRIQADPALMEKLDDERVLALRREAILRGWGILLAGVTVGVGLAPFLQLPDMAVLLTLLLLGVNAPIVIFLYLDRD